MRTLELDELLPSYNLANLANLIPWKAHIRGFCIRVTGLIVKPQEQHTQPGVLVMASNWKSVSELSGRPVPAGIKLITLMANKDGTPTTQAERVSTLAVSFDGRGKCVKVRDILETMDFIQATENEEFSATLAQIASQQGATDGLGTGSVAI